MLAELSKIEECAAVEGAQDSAYGERPRIRHRGRQTLSPGSRPPARTMIKMSQARANRRLRLRQLTVGLVVLTALILAVLGGSGSAPAGEARSFAPRRATRYAWRKWNVCRSCGRGTCSSCASLKGKSRRPAGSTRQSMRAGAGGHGGHSPGTAA